MRCKEEADLPHSQPGLLSVPPHTAMALYGWKLLQPKQCPGLSLQKARGWGPALFHRLHPPSSTLGARTGFLKSSSFSWPWSQPAPLLHPSHSFTGWSHFHNRSPDTLPALSTTLPKRLETICHLLHQHPAITLSPQHKPATPAAAPSPASNHAGQDQAPGTASEHSKPENKRTEPFLLLSVYLR